MGILDEEFIEENIDEYFKVGQKLNLTRTFAGDTEAYPTYVKDIGAKSIFIDTLIKGGIKVPIYEKKSVELAVITDGAIWTGISSVISIDSGRIEGVWVTYPKKLKKIQRREYMRWPLEFPVKVFVMKGSGSADEIAGTCFNVSGGGIAVYTRKEIPRHSELKVKFEYKDVSVYSRVKYIQVQYSMAKKRYITGFQFLEVDSKTADKIHKLGVQYQIEMRRKGLI